MPIPPEDVLYGAAYRVLFERADPDSTTTRERMTVVSAILDGVITWAADQPADVSLAYLRAVGDIGKRAEDTLENNERARQMHEAMNTLPRPPV